MEFCERMGYEMKFNRGEPFVGVEPPAEEVKNPMPSKEMLRQIRSCILSLRYINISPLKRDFLQKKSMQMNGINL